MVDLSNKIDIVITGDGTRISQGSIEDFLTGKNQTFTLVCSNTAGSGLMFVAKDNNKIKNVEITSNLSGERNISYSTKTGVASSAASGNNGVWSYMFNTSSSSYDGKSVTFFGVEAAKEEVIKKIVIDYSDNTQEVFENSKVTQPGIETMVLPRLDWYDEDGRIYKDALIENFNAIEAKLNEINALNAFETPTPDISSLSLENVTLDDSDTKVLNLRSFLTITGLINYPIELEFSGTKISKLAYWDADFHYIVKANIATEITKDDKFLFYNFTNEQIRVSNDATIQDGETLLGVYVDGRVINCNSPFIAKLNLMYLLGNMKTGTVSATPSAGQDNIYFGDGQQAALVRVESKTDYNKLNTFYQVGKE